MKSLTTAPTTRTPAAPNADSLVLLRQATEIARRQQDGIARLEQESVAATTDALNRLIPTMRDVLAHGGLPRSAVEEALLVVDTSLALLDALGEARRRLVHSLQTLGHTDGVLLNTEA